jgi:hypothetical protein
MRRLIYAVTLAMVFVGVVAVPAMADNPTTIPAALVWEDVNPCSGLPHEVTLDAVVSMHDHRNNGLFHVNYSGTTSSGFTLIAGQENAMSNDNVVRGTFSFQWRHADGSKFVEQGKFVINFQKNEMLVDALGSRCIGSG